MKNRILSCMVIFVILASCQEKAKGVETRAKADIRFDSHPIAESHRTVIVEKYNAGEANTGNGVKTQKHSSLLKRNLSF